MSNDTRNYYEKQLDLIDFAPTPSGSAHVIFGSAGQTTKALAVNAECAAAIIAKLIEVFMFPAVRPLPQAEPEPVGVRSDRLEGLRYTLGRDKNGNKLLRIKRQGAEDSRGFSIQTNGNLPLTHARGVGDWTPGEVRAYVREYGTVLQRKIVRA